MSQTRASFGTARFCLLLGLLCLPVYLAGSSPLVFWRDSSEFSMLGHNLDIGHPAGSPTFSMVEKLIDLLPLGSIAYRSTLLTIFFACGAAALLAWIVLRLAAVAGLKWPMGEIAALFSVSAFAFSPAWFDWVVAPEVYSAQVLIILAILAVVLVVRDAEEKGVQDRRWIFVAGFILGLSFGIHMGTILLAPGIAFMLFIPNRSVLNFRNILLFGCFVLIGFSVYVYLPVRSSTDIP